MVLISLFAIGAVTAFDDGNMTDAMEVSDDEIRDAMKGGEYEIVGIAAR